MSKLALGTAQFGMDYGIVGKQKPITHSEGRKMLSISKAAGIDLIDTAIAYGESEHFLGQIGVDKFKVVTKLPRLINDDDPYSWVLDHVQKSTLRLNIQSVYGLLLHSSMDLKSTKKSRLLIQAMHAMKDLGLVEKIGLSIYSPMELDLLESHINTLDIIQAPFNVVDRRLETSGWLRSLKEKDIEIHTRSVFLQGLLLIPRERVPSKFEKWSDLWDRWHTSLQKHGLSAVRECLTHPLAKSEIDRVIIGVNSRDQLEAAVSQTTSSNSGVDWSNMVSDDELLINPTNWNLF